MIKGIIFDWIGTLYERDKGLFPYSKRVLQELKSKFKLGLVSLAKQGVHTRIEELETSGILPYFDSVVIDTQKTSEHYLKCMQEMGTKINTTAIVDDRAFRGIQIGNQLGCRTFWIKKGEYAHEVPNDKTGEPNHRINSVEDLLLLLK